MADMITGARGKGHNTPPPRVDLTPMVDMGFLLITFFMFTTTLAAPRTLELNMPSKERPDSPTAFPEESTLTLLPGPGHRVYYYNGKFSGADTLSSVPLQQVVKLVAARKAHAAALPASISARAHQLHVIIRPADGSRFEDLVTVLDAMLIDQIDIYAVADITPQEAALMIPVRH